MKNKIIVTAANRAYYDTLLTLISSIHKYDSDLVDEIVVYDLGLDPEEIIALNKLLKVTVKLFNISELPYPDYLLPKGYAWKPHCIFSEKDSAKLILWLDAGTMLLKSAAEIFNIIEREDIFIVGDSHLNKNFTKQQCVQIMNATAGELDDVQISAAIIGYKSYGKFQHLIDEAYAYSLIDGCIVGHEENHRNDQSVYSILVSRYSCKKYDIDKYGYWTDISRTLQTAIEKDAVVFVHRRGHSDKKDLKYK